MATLDKIQSKKQLMRDAKNLGDIKVPLIGTLNKSKTRAKLNQDLKTLNGTVNLTGKVNKKGIVTSVQQATTQAQTAANKASIQVSVNLKKDKLINDIKVFGQQNTKLFKDANMAAKYNLLLDNAKLATSSKEVKDLRLQLSAMRSEIKATNLSGVTLGDTFRKTFKRVTELFTATGGVMLLTRQLRDAWTEALNLDKAYTNLIKVQDQLSRSNYPEYLEQCNKKAQDLATTQQSLIEGATEFSRSGYNLTESDRLAEKSVILSNVGDMSASDSAKAIISGVQAYDVIDGYNGVIDKAGALIDKYNEIGNTASITTGEIAQGVQSVGSVFADANTSVDEFIALLAAGNRQFQDADSLALGLRTSALRIRGCTTELEMMGEETEGVYTSAAKLEEKIKGLTNINGNGGVDILETDRKTFRSIYDIFLDISKVYRDMSDTDASALLELIAGKHRASAISATLNNMSEAQEIYQRSLESTGSAQEEYDKYLESSEASLNRFKASMTETYQSVISGETVTGLLNCGNAALQFVDSLGLIESTLKGLVAIGAVKLITSISAAFKASAISASNFGTALNTVKNMSTLTRGTTEYVNALKILKTVSVGLSETQLKQILVSKALSDSDRIAILRTTGLTKAQAQAKLEQLGLTQATKAQTAANASATASTFSLSAAVKGFGLSLKAAFVSNPIGISIMALSTIIGAVSSKISEHNEKIKETRQANIDAASSAKEKADTLRDLYVQYNNFNSITDKTSSQEKQFKQVVQDITKALGDKSKVLDGLTEGTDEYSKSLKDATKAELENQYTTAKIGAKAAEDVLRDATYSNWSGSLITVQQNEQIIDESHVAALEAVKDTLAKYEDKGIYGIEWEPVDWDSDKNNMTAVVEYYNALVEARNTLVTADNADLLMSSDIYEDINTTINDLSESVENYIEQQYNALKLNYEWQNGIPSTEEEFNKMKMAILDASGANQKFKEILEGYLTEDFSVFSNSSSSIKELTDDTVKAQDDLQSSALSFKDAWKSLGDTEDSDLKNTQKELLELAEAGQLTEKTFKKTSGAKEWAKSVSDPIGDIVDKINSLVTSSDQLSAMSKGISSLSENLYNKTENKDVKIIDADTLAGMSDELKACKKEWKAYEKVMGDANSSTEDAKKATNNLATAYVKSSNFLNNLTKENQNYYISQLENMGVENAREVVTSSLADRQKALELQTAACKAANTDFAGSTTDATASLLRENNVVGQTKVALFDLVVQETIFNDTSLNVQDRINKLNSLAKAYFGVSAGIQLANAGVMGTDSRYQKPIDEQYDEFLKKLQEPVDLDINTNGSKSKDKASKSKSKGSDSSKIFDYIEIRLKRLERLHSKYLKKAEDGTKSLAARNRAYNKVLATTEKQIKAQDKAISRYNKQLKKIGLDDNIAKKIRNGAFDIDTLKGKKKKKAERYQEIYEKRLDAVDERQELKEGRNQTKRDKIQTRIDNLENKRSILESASDKLQNDFDLDSTNSDYTKVNSALSKQISNYEKQNKLLQEQQKYVKKGSEEWYKYQDSIDANNQSIQDLTNSMTDNIVNGLDKSLKNLDSADELDEAREENAISASDKNKFADSRLARIFTRRQTYANSLANLGENIKTVATNNGNTAALSKISGYINSGELIPEDMLNGITDSELLYACDQYNAKVLEQQLYEETSKADIRNLTQDKADNIINEAENNLSKIDAKRAKTEAEIKKQEALGVGQSRKDYKEQIKLSRERQEELENEKRRLEEIRAEAIKNGDITEGDDEYNNLTDSINDIESSISDCVVEQIEFNNAIEDMDFSNYESLLKLLKQVSNQFSRYRSLADVHGNAVDDKILFAEIENDNEQIKAGKAEIERQFEEAKDKLMRSLDDGGWGLKLSEEQTDMVLNYVRAGQSGKIPEYLSGILGEDVNEKTYPGLFEFLDTIDSATDEIYNAYVDQEEKLDEWIDKRINGVNEYLDKLKKEKDIKDRTYAIEKAQYDLEKAKNNLTKKVWDGKQWVYAADTDAVQSAQEAYDNSQYEELINVGEDLIETLEDIKDYINFYDDYGNQILSTDFNTISETLTNQGIPNVDAFLKSKGIDIGAVDMSNFIKNLSSVPLTVNIPQLSTPNFANSYVNNPLNIDKIEFVLPNISDSSTAEDLAKGLINQLSNLSSYAKQYDWNK